MVTLYTSPSCTSCRKAKAWLEENDIGYTERNIFSEPLSIDEIKEILRMTEDGTDEIISTRSKTFQKLDVQVDAMPLQDLYELIQQNPGYCAVRLSLMKNVYKLVIMKTRSVVSYHVKCVLSNFAKLKDL